MATVKGKTKSKAKPDLTKTMTAIEEHVRDLAENTAKFIGENKSAGARARKSAQEIKKLCQTLRLDIQTTKNAM